jgi:hypothetical protein
MTQTMTPEEAAQKYAAVLVERQRLNLKKHTKKLTPAEAQRLTQLDAYLDDLDRVINPDFHALTRPLKGDT